MASRSVTGRSVGKLKIVLKFGLKSVQKVKIARRPKSNDGIMIQQNAIDLAKHSARGSVPKLRNAEQRAKNVDD